MKNKKFNFVVFSIIIALLVSSAGTSTVSAKGMASEISHPKYVHTKADTMDGGKSAIDPNIAVSSTNSFGKLFQESLNEKNEQQIENNGFNVFSVEMEGKKAKASIETTRDCTLVVGIYEENGVKMLATGKKAVTKDDRDVSLDIEIEEMPKYFLVRAFLIDSDSLKPLCTMYDTTVYTEEMQNFLSKTTEDFDDDQVLNLDSDKKNNFAVYEDNTKIISAENGRNQVKKIDEDENRYIFENADSSITSLKENDIFSYRYEEGKVLIVKVASIYLEGTTVTILGKDDISIDEVFEYIKIDGNAGMKDALVDTSELPEGIQYVERKSNGRKKADLTKEISDTYKLVDEKLGSGDNYVLVNGGVNWSASANIKKYKAKNIEYVELKINYFAAGNFSVAAQAKGTIPLGKYIFAFNVLPITISMQPAISVQLNASVDLNISIEGIVGCKLSQNEMMNLTTSPKVKTELTAEGTIYMGLMLNPKLSLLENIALAGIEATVGAEADCREDFFENKNQDDVKHECTNCLEGEIYFKGTFSAFIRLFDSDKLEKKITKKYSDKLSDFHYSLDFKEFSLSACPHKKYRVIVTAKNPNGSLVQGASVNKKKTDKNGKAEFWLNGGSYKITASKNGKDSVTKQISVKKPMRLTLKFKTDSLLTEPGLNTKLGVGDTAYFGNYIQDRITEEDEDVINLLKQFDFTDDKLTLQGIKFAKKFREYYQEAPIEWQILATQGDCYMMISKNVLATRAFDGTFWDDCDLRKWLNDEFYNDAFTSQEQNNISTTTLNTFVWPYEDCYIKHLEGHYVTTEDKVFLLDNEDVRNSAYGFGEEDENRIAHMTEYVDDNESASKWWLRGKFDWFYGNPQMQYISEKGELERWFPTYGYGVRPVIKVKKTAVSVMEPEKKQLQISEAKDLLDKKSKSNRRGIDNRDSEVSDNNPFANLSVDSIYNYYIVKSTDAKDVLSDSNLLYIGQGVTDETGTLDVLYKLKEEYENPKIIVSKLEGKNILNASIDVPDLKYNNQKNMVNPVVHYEGEILEEGVDYELMGDESAKDIGTYSVAIIGIGDYTGSVEKTYQVICDHLYGEWKITRQPTAEIDGIEERSCKICGYTEKKSIAKKIDENVKSVKKPGKVKGIYIKAGKKKINLKWKGQSNVSGFEIQYALNKSFTRERKIINAGEFADRKTIKGLKAKKVYYLRIRAYKKTSGKKIYGAWSSTKKVKIKK